MSASESQSRNATFHFLPVLELMNIYANYLGIQTIMNLNGLNDLYDVGMCLHEVAVILRWNL